MGAVTVVGIGADGELSALARERVRAAEVLLGGERHLSLVPGVPGQERRTWPQPLTGLRELLAELSGRRVVALASGDPFRSGIGTTLAAIVDDLEVLPAVSSVALACARMRWAAESVEVTSLVGRPVDAVRRELAPGRRLLVLSADETTPSRVGALLTAEGYVASRLTVLGNLGAATESRTEFNADAVPDDLPRLHVLAIEVDGPAAPVTSWVPGLPDDAYEHDGQLTKRDVRASALARLAPYPGAVLWDVGAGAGSVTIEWLRAHATTAAVAIEADPDRAARISRNAHRLGVPRLEIANGPAPSALDGLPAPDAVFVGGGVTADGLLERCRRALRPGGRLVVHAVTVESEQVLHAAYQQHGGELTRIAVERAEPLGSFTGWTPARAVTQWVWSA